MNLNEDNDQRECEGCEECEENKEILSPHDAYGGFMEVLDRGEWVYMCNDTIEDGRVFEMFEKKTDAKFAPLKCTGVIKASPEELLDFFLSASISTRKKITPNLSKYEIVKEFVPDIHLLHYVYKAPFPVKSRDFCLKRFIHRNDSNILICGVSIVDEDLPPLRKYIRGEIIMSGFYFEGIDEGETRVTSLVYVDPKGWIPSFVVKASKNGELAELKNLAKIVENNKE